MSSDSSSRACGSVAEEASGSLRHLQIVDILESMDEAFYALDRDWRFLYANKKAQRLWGKAASEVIGLRANEVFPTWIGSESQRAHQTAMETKRITRLETVSTVFGAPIELNIFPSEFGLAVYFRDITEQRRTAQALRDRDETLTLAEQSAGIGIWDMDLATGLTRYTPQFFRIMGLEPSSDRVPIERIRALRHPEDRDRVVEGFRDAVAGGKDHYEAEYRIIRPDGETRWIFGRGRVVRDASGMPVRYSGVDIDISNRKQAEARLKESEERLRLFVEHAPAAVAMLDEAMQFMAVSNRWIEAFRLKDRQVLGRAFYEVLPIASKDWAEAHRRCLAGEVQTREDYRFVGEDAVVRRLRWEMRPWSTASGAIGGIAVFCEDITERRGAEEQKELLLRELDHRVKNVFSVISSIVSLAARTAESTADLSAAVRARIDSLARAHSLIRGKGARDTTSVQAVVETVLGPFAQTAQRVVAQGPDIDLDTSHAVPLSMIVHELTTNAIKYGALSAETGKVAVAWKSETMAEGEQLVLRWTESDGPRVSEKGRSGFGTIVLEASARGMGGHIEIDYAADGVIAVLTVPRPAPE